MITYGCVDNLMPYDPDILIDTVSIDPFLIETIDSPSYDVQMAAVTANAFSIAFINNPCDAAKLAAISSCPKVIEYILDPTEEMQMISVTDHWTNIRLINSPCKVAQMTAVSHHPDAYDLICSPCLEAKLSIR